MLEITISGLLPSTNDDIFETRTISLTVKAEDTIPQIYGSILSSGIDASLLPDSLSSNSETYTTSSTSRYFAHHAYATVSSSSSIVSSASSSLVDDSVLSLTTPFRTFINSRRLPATISSDGDSDGHATSLEIDDGGLSVRFHRTLRLPDDETLHQLPASLGKFPLYNISTFESRLSGEIVRRGGVFFPMWMREAVWVEFRVPVGDRDGETRKYAIRPFVGGINAITGNRIDNKTKAGLNLEASPEGSNGHQLVTKVEETLQDYVVVPGQPWLDGICVDEGVVRQFVAMPLGSGYTIEGQKTGEEKHGGFHLEIVPQDQQKMYRVEAIHRPAPRIFKIIEQGHDALVTPSSLGLVEGEEVEIKEYVCRRPTTVQDILDENGGNWPEMKAVYSEEKRRAAKAAWTERSDRLWQETTRGLSQVQENLIHQNAEQTSKRTNQGDTEAKRREMLEMKLEERNKQNAEKKAEKLRQMREAQQARLGRPAISRPIPTTFEDILGPSKKMPDLGSESKGEHESDYSAETAKPKSPLLSGPYDPYEQPYDPYKPRISGPTSRTAQIQAQIDDTIGIMRDNINQVAVRGANLSQLQNKTEDLAVSAQGFRRGHRKSNSLSGLWGKIAWLPGWVGKQESTEAPPANDSAGGQVMSHEEVDRMREKIGKTAERAELINQLGASVEDEDNETIDKPSKTGETNEDVDILDNGFKGEHHARRSAGGVRERDQVDARRSRESSGSRTPSISPERSVETPYQASRRERRDARRVAAAALASTGATGHYPDERSTDETTPNLEPESNDEKLPTTTPPRHPQTPPQKKKKKKTAGFRAMGIAAGGKLIQDIVKDDDDTVKWNPDGSCLLNVHIFDSASFEAVTHIVPPPTPVTVSEYVAAGIPFYHVVEQVGKRLKGGDFKDVLPVAQMDEKYMLEAEVEEEFDPFKPRMCTECFSKLCDCIIRPCNHVFCHQCIMKIANEEYLATEDGKYHCPECGSAVVHVAGFAAPMSLPGEDGFEADVPVSLLGVEDGRVRFRSIFTSTL